LAFEVPVNGAGSLVSNGTLEFNVRDEFARESLVTIDGEVNLNDDSKIRVILNPETTTIGQQFRLISAN
jgi:hypothetical protein